MKKLGRFLLIKYFYVMMKFAYQKERIMTYKFDGENYLLRLVRGDELKASLDKFMDSAKITGAWLNGIGASSKLTLGTYVSTTKDYNWKQLDTDLEITSMIGNLAADGDGKMMFHIHGTFAGPDMRAIAGHIKDLTVNATLELFIHPTEQPLHRQLDDEIGLQLLAF